MSAKKSYFSLPKSDEDTNDLISKVRFNQKLFVDRSTNTLSTNFFNCYLAAARPILGHSQGDSLTNPMLITAFYLCQPEDHREPRNKVGSLSPAKRLAGFEPGTF